MPDVMDWPTQQKKLGRILLNELGAGAGEDDGDGSAEDLEIEPDGPIVDVFEVEAHPIAKGIYIIAAADLPQAGEARLDTESPAMCGIVEAFDFIDGQRARTDEA